MKERTYTYNNSKVKVVLGNLLDSKADVIVSSDDCELSMGGGISAAISEAAGEDMRADAHKKTPARLGDVVVTSSGALDYKFIFHAVTIDLYRNVEKFGDEKTSADIQEFIVKESVKKCFRLMSILGVSSIAFPAIGSGVANIPFSKVSRYMAEAIHEMLYQTNKELCVELWIYDCYHMMTESDLISFYENFSAMEYFGNATVTSGVLDETDYSKTVIAGDGDVKNMEGSSVFISYSRRDLEQIKSIIDLLNKMGISYWIDVKNDHIGENFKTAIYNAIENAKIVLFISSANSNASRNVVKEISLADKMEKTIIPIMIDKSSYTTSISYDISNIDAINYIDRKTETLLKIRNAILARLAMEKSDKAANIKK